MNQVIDKYEKNPESLSDEEKLAVQAKYVADQITAGVDPGSWYNIGQTTRASLPFMRDFIVTAPLGGAGAGVVKGGASTLAAKTGANFLLSRGIGPTISKLGKGAIDLSVRPAIQSMFSPSSYAMAFEEMQGQAIDRDEQGNIGFDNRKSFDHGMTSAFIENQSEVLGEVVLDKLFQKFRIPVPKFLKTNAAKRLSSATGIKGPITEYAEEKYSDLANIFRGEQTIEGFFDPRQNLEFPQVNADIFLSHSHINEPTAIFLAGLFDSFGLSTFIDSCVWGYSNDLLKMIDNKYCKKIDKPFNYDYDKRNQSTSHIHMMLNTALMNMINKFECLILLNTPDSIKLSDIKNRTETLSPWIYSEISISKLIKKDIPARRNKERIVNMMEDGGRIIRKAFSAEEMIDVKYKVDLNHLVNLDLYKWFEYIENNKIKEGVDSLDALYDTHPLPKRSIIKD